MKNKINCLKGKEILILLALFVMSIVTYCWTIDLPVIGDGLMHMNDHMNINNPINWFKCFFTFDGIGKPAGSATLGFHRPLFDEIIVEILKIITHDNIRSIRVINLIAFVIAVYIGYYMAKEIFYNEKLAIIYVILINFNMAYFAGMIEVGLSFSIWLLINLQLSFWFTYRYEKYDKKRDLVISLIWTLLTMFTKESTMTLGIALCFFVLAEEWRKYFKVTRKAFIYGILQGGITFLYLITRYLKLGSLFTAGAGIDTTITLKQSIVKVVGYFLCAFNIPSRAFYAYVCPQIDNKYPVLMMILLLAPLMAIVNFIIAIRKKEYKWICFATYIIMYLIMILPVLKVSRNATYYGDVLTPFVILGTITLFDGCGEKIKKYVIIGIVMYIVSFCVIIIEATKIDSVYYLSVVSGECKVIRDELEEINPKIKNNVILQADSWESYGSNYWTYNHNGIGGFYTYNIDSSKKIEMATAENIGDNTTIIDYFQVEGKQKWKVFYYEDKSEETEVIKIAFDPDSSDTIRVRFQKDKEVFYREYTVEGKQYWSQETNIYIVVPKNSNLQIEGNVREYNAVLE